MFFRSELLIVLTFLLTRSQVKGQEGVHQAELTINFVKYENPNGLGANGACCESFDPLRVLGCPTTTKTCDTYFIVEVFSVTRSALLGYYRSKIWDDTNTIVFNEYLNEETHLTNPITIQMSQWEERGYKIQIKAMDSDAMDGDDLIHEWSMTYSGLRQNMTTIFNNIHNVRLLVTINSRCLTNYYGGNCSIFCADDRISTCNPSTGQRLCKPGYSGEGCRVFNPCARVYCGNGTCLVGRCICNAGYTGNSCQSDINECLSSPCLNGGTCRNQVNKWVCYCARGYTGDRCQVNNDDCRGVVCHNGGTCVDLVGGYRCACKKGFTGNQCENNIDDCTGINCHYGTCQDGLNDYACVCNSGFTGQHCERNIDDCSSKPCYYNSSCVDLINGYRCVCSPGYAGNRCQTDINECLSNPCLNGGVCINQMNKWSCDCSRGFSGDQCQININDCEGVECLHGGTCLDLVDSYRCACTAGYKGIHCQDNANSCQGVVCEGQRTAIDSPLLPPESLALVAESPNSQLDSLRATMTCDCPFKSTKCLCSLNISSLMNVSCVDNKVNTTSIAIVTCSAAQGRLGFCGALYQVTETKVPDAGEKCILLRNRSCAEDKLSVEFDHWSSLESSLFNCSSMLHNCQMPNDYSIFCIRTEKANHILFIDSLALLREHWYIIVAPAVLVLVITVVACAAWFSGRLHSRYKVSSTQEVASNSHYEHVYDGLTHHNPVFNNSLNQLTSFYKASKPLDSRMSGQYNIYEDPHKTIHGTDTWDSASMSTDNYNINHYSTPTTSITYIRPADLQRSAELEQLPPLEEVPHNRSSPIPLPPPPPIYEQTDEDIFTEPLPPPPSHIPPPLPADTFHVLSLQQARASPVVATSNSKKREKPKHGKAKNPKKVHNRPKEMTKNDFQLIAAKAKNISNAWSEKSNSLIVNMNDAPSVQGGAQQNVNPLYTPEAKQQNLFKKNLLYTTSPDSDIN